MGPILTPRVRTAATLVAVAGLVLASGCSLILSDSQQFTATPAGLCPAETSATGYSIDDEQWVNETREFEAVGQFREVRIDSYRRTYVRERPDGGNQTGGVVVFATPRAVIAGEPRNPVGSWSHRRVLAEFGDDFGRYGTLTNASQTGTDSRDVLDSPASVSRFDAIGQTDSDAVDVRVTVARLEHADDFLLVGTVHELGDAAARQRIERVADCLDHGGGDSTDGGSNATTTVETTEQDPGQATMASRTKIVSATGGDEVSIPVALQRTNTTTLVLGSRPLNYRVAVDVADRDGDGSVTVTWNTSVAGRTANESRAFGATGSDEVTGVSRSTGRLSTQLANTSYPVSLRVDGVETGVGTVILRKVASGS